MVVRSIGWLGKAVDSQRTGAVVFTRTHDTAGECNLLYNIKQHEVAQCSGTLFHPPRWIGETGADGVKY